MRHSRATVARAAALVLVALTAILGFGGCSFDLSSPRGDALPTIPAIPTATPRPTPGANSCADAADAAAFTRYHSQASSAVAWEGPDDSWHVEKYVLYNPISGAYCGSYAYAVWALDLGVANIPAAPSWQVCAWLDGQQPSCGPAYLPQPPLPPGAGKVVGGSLGSEFRGPRQTVSYDAATGRLAGVTPCLVAHMTFSRYPGVELTANQCDKLGHQ